jgi:cytochrome c oxidase subunit 3
MASQHAHGAEEELHLPHGSKWPILIAVGIALIYFGLVFGWALLGLGLLVAVVGMVGIVTEDNRWWEGRISTGLRNGWWGVLFFLGTEVMLFAALFATYFNHRAYGGAGWGLDEHGEFFLSSAVVSTGINTIILLLSGVTMHWAHSGIRKGNHKQLKIGLLLTILLGAVFLGGQVLEYLELAREGLIIQNGTFGGMFYILTGTHGAHVLGGLGVIGLATWRAFKGQFDQQRHVAVEVTAIYWHFVDVVWVLLFAVVYLRMF